MSSDADEKSLRYRRAQSVTTAEEITEKERKARKSQLDKPCHVPRDSLFTWSSQFNNFTGLVNWGFLLLSIGGLRLCLENFLKYGFRVNPLDWFAFFAGQGQGHNCPSLILMVFSIVPVLLCLYIEKLMSVNVISKKLGGILQISNILFVISLPPIMIQYKGQDFSFVGISTVCNFYLVLFLKLWSYVQTNHWCRINAKGKNAKKSLRRQSISAPDWKTIEEKKVDKSSPVLVTYPDNLHLKDLLYFLLAPTLCYELNFPKTSRIRKRFLIKRFLELVVGVNLVLALLQQWIIPSVTNSLETFSNMDYVRITERLLKLALPNHLIWLCFFYLTFHSFLNLMGEVLHFADRNFYCDWWNSNNIEVFWRTWNMPVHRWAVRHVYVPITSKGYSRGLASVVVFFISAFFHEYLVSVPLRMFRIWAFLGMMAQLPLSQISRFVELKVGPLWGNIIVWNSLIIGQPLVIMMYYHDYALLNMKITDPILSAQ